MRGDCPLDEPCSQSCPCGAQPACMVEKSGEYPRGVQALKQAQPQRRLAAITEFSTSNPLLQSIVENGVGGIAEGVGAAQRWHEAGEGEPSRCGKLPAFKDEDRPCERLQARTIRNKFGKIRLDVPQVQDGGFYPSVLWQRCQFHIQRNAVVRVARKSMRTEIHRDIRNVFSMPSWAQRSRGCSGAPWRNTAGKGIPG